MIPPLERNHPDGTVVIERTTELEGQVCPICELALSTAHYHHLRTGKSRWQNGVLVTDEHGNPL